MAEKNAPKSLQEHFEDCKKVSDVVANANALLKKSQKRLIEVRSALECLRDFQHPKLVIGNLQYSSVGGNNEKCTPLYAIDHEIAQINELLGDRA